MTDVWSEDDEWRQARCQEAFVPLAFPEYDAPEEAYHRWQGKEEAYEFEQFKARRGCKCCLSLCHSSR